MSHHHLPPEHEVTGSNPVGTTNFLGESTYTVAEGSVAEIER